MSILVTGGTGVLGTQVVRKLVDRGQDVLVLSRKEGDPVHGAPRFVGDLATGEGIESAVSVADTVAHLATNPFFRTKATDVEGTRRLLQAAREVGIGHFLYVSIVGVDRHPWPYYKRKYEAELLVEAMGVPHTILRAPQFHDLIFLFLKTASRLPVLFLPKGVKFQVVDSSEVADRVVELLLQGPQGRVRAFGGPVARDLDDLARAYMAKRGISKPIVRVPMLGKSGSAFRAGLHLCPDDALGRGTWEEYLERVL